MTNTTTSSTYNRNTKAVTINVRESFPAATYGQETVYIPFAELSPSILQDILEQGALRILKDGAGGKDKSDVEKAAGMNKRIDAWKTGTFTIVERADSLTSLMKEAYIAERLAKHDTTQAKVEKAMAETVKETLGKDTKATFDNFLLAVATQLAKRDGETRKVTELHEALAARYEGEARKLSAARSKAEQVKLDLTDIEI